MSSESAARPLHAGRLFLVTAPSGAGKSSLVNALLKLEHCNVPHRRATSATKERAYLKHDGFVARLQRAEVMATDDGEKK